MVHNLHRKELSLITEVSLFEYIRSFKSCLLFQLLKSEDYLFHLSLPTISRLIIAFTFERSIPGLSVKCFEPSRPSSSPENAMQIILLL